MLGRGLGSRVYLHKENIALQSLVVRTIKVQYLPSWCPEEGIH